MFCKKCGQKLKDGARFCTKCGNSQEPVLTTIQKRSYKKPLLVGIALLVFLIAIGYFFFSQQRLSDDIASLVVNIYCESDYNEEASGGSGTIFSEDGLVLTNAHIIPINEQTGEIDDESVCLVILPDPTTGSPDEIYWAYPIIASGLSEKYDLAFVQIHDVFYDPDEGIAYGDYPKKFPSYTGEQCKEENVKLGESVRVYGYPAISGGYVLTITDGVVSSLLPDEGLIITSAKISHGNSGGIAVDQYGCMIGVPSTVTGDENESLGIIISNDLIADFTDELNATIELLGEGE